LAALNASTVRSPVVVAKFVKAFWFAYICQQKDAQQLLHAYNPKASMFAHRLAHA